MMRLCTTLGLLFILSSCDSVVSSSVSDEIIPQSGRSIVSYYISDYQKIDNSCKIIDSTVVISDTKIINYSDIISYSPEDYTFTVSEKISEDFKNHSFFGVPFALTIDREIIYTGYFWSSFSSQACDWITIDLLNFSRENKLSVQLGYPGMFRGDSIPDNRNDPRLIEILRKDGKLKQD